VSTLKESIYGLLFDELQAWLELIGEKKFRAKQIWQWLYVQRVQQWDEMKNVSGPLREKLAAAFELNPLELVEAQGVECETRKLLCRLKDDELIELVLIPAEKRRTVCVSSQVGCKFGCVFCASGQSGFRRSLTAGEIVAEVLQAGRVYGERVSHIVFMGIGEPFDNYENVIKAARIMNHPDGLGISSRRITISTSGVIPGIERLADEPEQFELSVSLHASNSELRSQLMPVNKRYPMPDLIAACKAYTKKTKRIITFEYTMVRDVNDSREHSLELVQLIRSFPCRVNLIPLSPVDEFDGLPPLDASVRNFMETLTKHGINTTLRFSKGTNVDGACGQLRVRHL
jgi:23S rRNA (adenine2503-C2)-methyltransferase